MTSFDLPPAVLPPPPVSLPPLGGAMTEDDFVCQVTTRHQDFLTTMTSVHKRFLNSQRALARALGARALGAVTTAAPPSPIRSLTFVVTVGRSGSTALSRILDTHPDVLSLNEFFFSVRSLLPTEGLVSADRFWKMLAEPHPVFDAMVRGDAGLPEFLYPDLPETRFSAESGGIPAVSMMTLPHLSDTPDAVFDALAAEVASWPDQTTSEHYRRLFAWLADRFGGTVAVERSGMSLGAVPWLRRCFPDAKFVHLHRNGPDCAVSMSRHTGFRLLARVLEGLELLDLGELEGPNLERVSQLDPSALPAELAPLLGDRYQRDYLMGLDLPVTRFAELWSQLVELGVSALADLPADRHTTLSYEELLADPADRLSELAGFIGIEPCADWLASSAASLDSSRAGAASRLPPDEFRAVRDCCAPGAAALRL